MDNEVYIYLEVEGFVKVWLNVLVEDIGVPAAPLEAAPARGLLQQVDHSVGVLASAVKRSIGSTTGCTITGLVVLGPSPG